MGSEMCIRDRWNPLKHAMEPLLAVAGFQLFRRGRIWVFANTSAMSAVLKSCNADSSSRESASPLLRQDAMAMLKCTWHHQL